MKAVRNPLLPAVLLVGGVVAPAESQVSQEEIARQVLSADRTEQFRGLRQVESIEPPDIGRPLREAMILALERENAAHLEQSEAIRRGVTYEESDDFHPQVTLAVIALRDLQTIPALGGALGTGTMAPRALAEFGEAAVATLLQVVTSHQSQSGVVNGGLIALRFMVERGAVEPLSAASLQQIRAATQHHLTRPQSGIGASLRWAIDLAIALDDPELRAIVESIANDPNEIIARGLEAPHLIEQTRKRAADRLAGLPPLPRLR